MLRLRLPAIALLAVLAAPSVAVTSGQARAQVGRDAWQAVNAGKIVEARVAFDEALRRDPNEPTLLLGAGVVAYLQGRADEARVFLVSALKENPGLTAASLLLGEVLYRSGDIDGAIGVYEQALQLAPGQAQMTAKLDAWRREATLHSRFGQKLGDHFTVLFEGPAEAQLAQRAVEILEAAYWRIGTALYTYPPAVITVVLYTREQFRDVTQSPAWAAGAFDGRIRLPVQGALQNPREFERVLTHEFTHALIRSIAPRGVPVWLDEGLAVQFEGSNIDRQRAQVRGAESVPPLARLEGAFDKLDARQATVAYAESAVAVQMLLEEAGPSGVVGLLTDIGRSVPFADAFQRNILVSYADFQKRLISGTQQ